MRFKDTVFYPVDELLLDQENYRFGFALSQKDCIDLIYKDSPDNFENLLKDIIENNIGDYPLVFINSKNEKIVLDGNRRVSILKIINKPDLAPSKKIHDLVVNLDKSKLPFDLNKIGCFVSKDKQEILKTVYERHAAGKGISRIQWSAFATAKFRYDTEIQDNDWRAIAILLHIISFDESTNNLIKKPNFSFEVFRRMVRHAYSNGYLHFNIFNEDKNVLNSDSDYFNNAVELIKKIVKAIDNNEVGLSRNKNYASEDFLKNYFSHHFIKVTNVKPPRKRKSQTAQKKEKLTENETASLNNKIEKNDDLHSKNTSKISSQNTDEDTVTPDSAQAQQAEQTSSKHTPPQIDLPLGEKNPTLDIQEPSALIEKNPDLINALNKLSIQKFSLIYNSLCQLNIKKYPILAVIATWAFLDSLPRVNQWDGTDFTSYYNSVLKTLITKKDLQTSIRHSISWLHVEGNCNKHSSDYVTLDHKEFIKHFNNIQVFISKVIEQKLLPAIVMAKTSDL